VLIAVVVCASVMLGAVFSVNRYIDAKVAKIPRVAVSTGAAGSGGTNYLIVGSDTRAFVKSQAERQAFTDSQTTVDGPARSDTMMVLHADGKRSYAVSFPRDLWVNIPGRGDMKLNAAFVDGPQKVLDTLKADFNLDINHYLEFNFKTFEDIVNAVGSVPVYFPYPVRDRLSGLGPTPVAGCYHLDGPNSLAYVRARHLEYYKNGRWVASDPLSDLDRIQRQQSFIRKLGGIAVRQTLADPFLAPNLADHMIPNLAADPGFDRNAFNQLVEAFIGLAGNNQAGPTFTTLPWDGPATRSGGQSVLLVKHPQADAVLAVLRGTAPIPSPTPPAASVVGVGAAGKGAIRPVDVRVRVLNASGVKGAAGVASSAFTRLGFPSGGVANDPRGLVDHSEVRYSPGSETSAQLVAASVSGAPLVADASLAGTDVVVVIGKNFPGVGTAVATPSAPTPTTPSTAAALSSEAACN
jgi:LCP family protein required for cell wall assembly